MLPKLFFDLFQTSQSLCTGCSLCWELFPEATTWLMGGTYQKSVYRAHSPERLPFFEQCSFFLPPYHPSFFSIAVILMSVSPTKTSGAGRQGSWAVSPVYGISLAHRLLCIAGPSATFTPRTRCSIPAHHEVGIGDVVLDHAPAQDDHSRVLGEDGLGIDEPQVWRRTLWSGPGPSQLSDPAPLWSQCLTLHDVKHQARVLVGMEEDHVAQGAICECWAQHRYVVLGEGRIGQQWESEPNGVSLVPILVAFPLLCLILDRVLNF